MRITYRKGRLIATLAFLCMFLLCILAVPGTMRAEEVEEGCEIGCISDDPPSPPIQDVAFTACYGYDQAQ